MIAREEIDETFDICRSLVGKRRYIQYSVHACIYERDLADKWQFVLQIRLSIRYDNSSLYHSGAGTAFPISSFSCRQRFYATADNIIQTALCV